MAKKLQPKEKEKKVKPDLNIAYEKFCQHYSEHTNATQAYLFAFPEAKYSTANTEGPQFLLKPRISERILQLKEEFILKYGQTKDKTIKDLINAAEMALKESQYAAYAKLREMIIRMQGFYEPDKIEHSGSLNINLQIPGIDDTKVDEPEE